MYECQASSKTEPGRNTITVEGGVASSRKGLPGSGFKHLFGLFATLALGLQSRQVTI